LLVISVDVNGSIIAVDGGKATVEEDVTGDVSCGDGSVVAVEVTGNCAAVVVRTFVIVTGNVVCSTATGELAVLPTVDTGKIADVAAAVELSGNCGAMVVAGVVMGVWVSARCVVPAADVAATSRKDQV